MKNVHLSAPLTSPLSEADFPIQIEVGESTLRPEEDAAIRQRAASALRFASQQIREVHVWIRQGPTVAATVETIFSSGQRLYTQARDHSATRATAHALKRMKNRARRLHSRHRHGQS